MRLDFRDVPWLLALAAVLGGWALGYVFWRDPDSADDFRSGLDLFGRTMTVLMVAPLALAAGALRSSSSPRHRAAGLVLLALAALGGAYLAWFAFFGGICFDPGDVCETSWPSRVLELMTASACVGLGWLVERRRARRGV
jgi:hypothetical protein